MPDSASQRRFRKLLWATASMVYLLIVVGGIVRVTGSGLGCPDWPRCFGEWIPPLRADAIIEYSHRLVATLTSPLILASAVVAWWRFRAVRWVSDPLLYVVVLLGVQGLLGGVVVLLETPPNLVAVHLGNAFLIQAMVILPLVVIARTSPSALPDARLSFQTPLARLARLTLIILFLMILSGALVVGSNSTYACSGWPLCNGELFPQAATARLHMFHRAMVLLAALFILKATHDALRSKSYSPAIRRTAIYVLLLFFAQATVGALKVSLAFPTWLLGLHVALAAAVWASVVVFAALAALEPPTKA